MPEAPVTRVMWRTLATTLTAAVVATTPVMAQLDPLLFVKRLPPNVIVVVDTSLPMLKDRAGSFYDPHTYTVADDPDVARAMGVDVAGAVQYRRVYHGLHMEAPITPARKYSTSTIVAVDDTSTAYPTFWDATRLEIAKAGITQAAAENQGIGNRWALVGLRQRNPRWRTSLDCDLPNGLQVVGDVTPCHAGQPGRFGVYAPAVDAPNYSLRLASGVRLPFGSVSASELIDVVDRPVNDPLGLIPAGRDQRFFVDRPITFALEDALDQARIAIAADPGHIDCRNTVVVLVTGGADSGGRRYERVNDPASTAARFLAVSAGGAARRVPIYVAAIRPESSERQLRRIATESGGRYFNVSDPRAVSRVINIAIQTGYARSTDFNLGTPSEYQPVSPVVGTVDLTDARSSRGRRLRDTVIRNQNDQTIPQRSNLMVTAGFELNGTGEHGMEGVVRAFRTFRPQRDQSQPGGYAFVSDGTALWPDVDAYAGDNAERRSIIWVGVNNGMVHAIDARTSIEVWAFIPYNLLPKLRTLMDGQPIERFDYFVDSSPKVAEVKLQGVWRTILVIGQSYGGSFYQAFDVTAAGTGGPPPSSDDYVSVLASFDEPSHIRLLWSFPRYDVFDPDVTAAYALTDGFPGDEVRFFGDLGAGATPAEKSVGFTWSAPAIAPLDADHGVTAAIVGSGYFPAVENRLPGRGAGAPSAGQSLFLINIETGTLVGGASSCGGAGAAVVWMSVTAVERVERMPCRLTPPPPVRRSSLTPPPPSTRGTSMASTGASTSRRPDRSPSRGWSTRERRSMPRRASVSNQVTFERCSLAPAAICSRQSPMAGPSRPGYMVCVMTEMVVGRVCPSCERWVG